jgi:uridine kinase
MNSGNTIWEIRKSCLVAIVGGSGAGKTWLAEQLQKAIGKDACRISLDDFYQDHSRLAPSLRERINFDHPRAVDWPALEKALLACRNNEPIRLPSYDFATHTRKGLDRLLKTKPIVLVDGLWLLRRASLRKLFEFKIFLDCPASIRLERRLARDCCERGRNPASVIAQFQKTVAPMHDRFVDSQRRWADVVYREQLGPAEINQLARQLRNLLATLSNHV